MGTVLVPLWKVTNSASWWSCQNQALCQQHWCYLAVECQLSIASASCETGYKLELNLFPKRHLQFGKDGWPLQVPLIVCDSKICSPLSYVRGIWPESSAAQGLLLHCWKLCYVSLPGADCFRQTLRCCWPRKPRKAKLSPLISWDRGPPSLSIIWSLSVNGM